MNYMKLQAALTFVTYILEQQSLYFTETLLLYRPVCLLNEIDLQPTAIHFI